MSSRLAALGPEEYLAQRARHASDAAFAEALAQVPDVPPLAGDEVLRP